MTILITVSLTNVTQISVPPTAVIVSLAGTLFWFLTAVISGVKAVTHTIVQTIVTKQAWFAMTVFVTISLTDVAKVPIPSTAVIIAFARAFFCCWFHTAVVAPVETWPNTIVSATNKSGFALVVFVTVSFADTTKVPISAAAIVIALAKGFFCGIHATVVTRVKVWPHAIVQIIAALEARLAMTIFVTVAFAHITKVPILPTAMVIPITQTSY